ncbi:hypothetical protein JQ621_02990 [Bradyrhizobium manausense]|nr:hypothetical protein [Bradyrhizobium manausense]MBR1086436.1 hypothetical protein [Bradyrhizobium manausense]
MDPGQYIMAFVLLAIWYGYAYWPFVLLWIVACLIVVVLVGARKNSSKN